MSEEIKVAETEIENNEERIPKVIFVTADTEVVSISAIRRVEYTQKEKIENNIKENDYTLVHAGCFSVQEADGYDTMTGNTFILNDEDEWELIGEDTEVNTEE